MSYSAILVTVSLCVLVSASSRKGGPTLPPPPFVAHHMPAFGDAEGPDDRPIGRSGLNSADIFWRAGWQPVPMHSIGGNDKERVPYLNKALDFVPADPAGANGAVPHSIGLTTYSVELPKGHKVFSLVSPIVDDLPKRKADHTQQGAAGAVAASVDSNDEYAKHLKSLFMPVDQSYPNKIEKWSGMCSSSTDKDWCFITIGCWGSGHIPTQSKVAKAMDTILEKYAGRDLFPTSGEPTKRVIKPCDIRFGTLNGDNFYQSGITYTETSRLASGFELIYSSPALLAMPWFVSLGNHDYRGDWFQQVPLTNRPVIDTWGHVGGAGPGDSETGGWVSSMDKNTALTDSNLRPLRALDLKGKEQTFSTGRWYLPHPYHSARVAEEMVLISLDCVLLERCKNNGNDQARCWDKGAQLGWLKSLLETLDYDPLLKYRVIQCHYPIYANGPHVNHPWLIEAIEPLMVKHGVQLYVNADNHYLQVSKKEIAATQSAAQSDVATASKRAYYFVNSGGGGGYGMNHQKTDKGYAVNTFSVFDEVRNGPMFHCLRDVGTPKERLVTMVYNDDAEKLFEFDVLPFVSPLAVPMPKVPAPFEPPAAAVSAKKAGDSNVDGIGQSGVTLLLHTVVVPHPEVNLHTIAVICCCLGAFVAVFTWRKRRSFFGRSTSSLKRDRP